jgi:hypothetical protein
LTIKEWTDNNYSPLKDACKRIAEGNELSEELLHYVLSEFLDKPDVQKIVMSGGAFFFCLRMATNSWKSTTSPFYRMYRDPNMQCVIPDIPEPEEEEDNSESLWKHAQEKINELGWYEKELLQVYAENNGNASLVSRLTKIPRTSINLTIRKVKLHITQSLGETNGRQNNKIDMKDIVYYKLGDHEEVLQSERWCLEGQIQEDKFRLGLGPYAEYKELPDYEPPNPFPELTAYLSDVCNPNKPTTILKRSRKAKTKSQATNMSTVLNVLDDIDPINLVPEVLRDSFTRSVTTVSNGMDK